MQINNYECQVLKWYQVLCYLVKWYPSKMLSLVFIIIYPVCDFIGLSVLYIAGGMYCHVRLADFVLPASVAHGDGARCKTVPRC